MTVHAVYLKTIFNPEFFPLTIEKVLTAVRHFVKTKQADSIAFSGISGAAAAFIVARELNLSLVCVRKRGDGSHFFEGGSSGDEINIEGDLNAKRFVILDDMISTGATVDYITGSIKQYMPQARCVGMVMYAAYSNDWRYLEYPDEVPYAVDVISSRPQESK